MTATLVRTPGVPELPGPSGPAWAQTLRLVSRPLPFLLRAHRRFGDCFRIRIVGGRSYVLLSHPEAVAEVISRRQLHIGNEELRPVLGDNSLILLDGEAHRRHRRLMAPSVHGRAIRRCVPMIERVVEEHARRLSGASRFRVYPWTQELCLEVILRMALGESGEGRLRAYAATLQELIDLANAAVMLLPFLQRDLGPGSPGRRFHRLLARLDGLVREDIERRRQPREGRADDVLSGLVDATEESGRGLTDGEIRDELVTLLVAGHEPTTAALAWALYWIHACPEAEARLRQELRGAMGAAEAARLPYLDAVCKETLRRTPVVPLIERTFDENLVLAGYRVPAGTRIAPCIYLLHQRDDLYPEPGRFRPERFLERQFGPHEYMPFGGGIRRCLGQAFAMQQLKITLAVLLTRLRLRSHAPERVRLDCRGAVVRPSAGFSLRVVAGAAESR